MKKIIFLLCLGLGVFCSESINAQSATTLRSQRDSLEALYKFVLDKYDSVSVANMELEKKLTRMGVEIADLKKEFENILKKRGEAQTQLMTAKKLIEDQAALIEKLEAEVKRLSPPKKTNQ